MQYVTENKFQTTDKKELAQKVQQVAERILKERLKAGTTK